MKADRRSTLKEIIGRSRFDCSLPRLAPADQEAMIDSWLTLLDKIPTRFLHESYTAAMIEHCSRDPGAPFKAGTIFVAYHQLCQSGKINQAMIGAGRFLAPPVDCPHNCASGWILEKGLDGTEKAKRCPIHTARRS